jgi:hypothetical protein
MAAIASSVDGLIDLRARPDRRSVDSDARDPWPALLEVVMLIDKAEIMALLLSRGNEDRAAWVDRILPEYVDTDANASLLRMLEIDLSVMSEAKPAEPPS